MTSPTSTIRPKRLIPPNQSTKMPPLSPFLISHGLAYIFQGLLVGLIVHSGIFTYPRIALAAHISFMGTGTIFLLLGIILHPSIWPFDSPGYMLRHLITWSTYGGYVTAYSEIINAFWGSTTMLPIAAAASPGARFGWQDKVIDAGHMIPAILLIGSIGGLVVLAWKGKREDVVELRYKKDWEDGWEWVASWI